MIEKDGYYFQDEPRIALPAYDVEIIPDDMLRVVKYQSIPVVELWVYGAGNWHVHDRVIV